MFEHRITTKLTTALSYTIPGFGNGGVSHTNICEFLTFAKEKPLKEDMFDLKTQLYELLEFSGPDALSALNAIPGMVIIVPPWIETYSGTSERLSHSVTTRPGDAEFARNGYCPVHAPIYTALKHISFDALQYESRKLLCRTATLQKSLKCKARNYFISVLECAIHHRRS